LVAHNLNRIDSFEDEISTTSVKEAACTAFAGIYAEGLSPLVANLSLSSAASETVKYYPVLCLSIVIILPSAQTVGTLLVFLLAMVLHPDVQVKTQADIDRIIGKDRLVALRGTPSCIKY
jgi:hypothetical protein